MIELPSRYTPKEVEDKWLRYWKSSGVFHAVADPAKKPFTVVIPPPNVTGILHMGHALNNTLQDILVRYKRMNGFETLWMVGTDHAGIATQNVVEKELAKEGKKRQDLGREEFLRRLWAWKENYGNTIIRQLERLGSSCDWPRTRFTMDEAYSEAVKEVFVRLYDKDLIYRGKRIINWCPRCQTALSDEEAEHKEKQGKLYHLKYPLKNHPHQFVIVATTRPETMLGDTAVAVNPLDERYKNLIGQTLVLPLINREIKIIADEFVSMEFGTGAVKVTPAHDPNDFTMGNRHKLEFINIMQPDAVLNENAGKFKGMDRFAARKAVVAELEAQGLLVKIEEHKHAVAHCYRCDTVVEPYLSWQWFVKMEPLARPAIAAVKSGRLKIQPERWEKVYLNWMENIQDWCISRQIWWGHQIPVWTLPLHGPWGVPDPLKEYLREAGVEQDVVVKSIRKGDVDIIEVCTKTKKADEALKYLNAFYQDTSAKPFDPKLQNVFPSQKAKKFAEDLMGRMASDQIRQDSDVLDTWFSSWLWPFATLGWPKDNPDLKYFYPTDALFTASEIIFFWVARMVMAGYEFMGDAPFSDVYIHGTVRDAKGRKMSKSLGNALDPLEIIDEYGADALRFSLIINSGQDIFISKEKFEIGRNFANKIWNASRLIFMNVKDIDLKHIENIDFKSLDLPSKWVISQLHATIEKVRESIEKYRYSEAETLVQDFFWGNFCDWYLEIIKSQWSDPAIQKTAIYVLERSLRMMHPFLPFVTEEIYSHLRQETGSLARAPWPSIRKEWIEDRSRRDMQTLIDVVTSVRNLRMQWNIKPNETVDCILSLPDQAQVELFKTQFIKLQALARIKDFEIRINAAPIKDAATAVVGAVKLFIPLAGIIDLAKEKQRIAEQIQKLEKQAEGIASRLNSDFAKKAPAEVVAKDQDRLRALEFEILELRKVLTSLS